MSGVANFLQVCFTIHYYDILYLEFTFQSYMFTRSGEKLTKRVRHLMFESMMQQEIGWFDLKDNNVGALCTRLSSQASSIQGVSYIFLHSISHQFADVNFRLPGNA